MDYVCSYSTKLGNTIEAVLKPLFDPSGGGKYAGKVKIIFRNQVQPWHGTSILLHEAGLAVRARRTLAGRPCPWRLNPAVADGACCP